MTLVVLVDTRSSNSLSEAYQHGCDRLERLVEQLGTPRAGLELHDLETGEESELRFESNFSQPAFCDAVRQCVEYIGAGDIFQVVISQRLKIPVASDPFDVYRTLRVVNPSPFMFFLRTPEVTLVGSSPEIMCRVMQGRVTVRPLAGTRPRGAKRRRRSPPGRRNCCRIPRSGPSTSCWSIWDGTTWAASPVTGRVELSDVMTIERYSHVMHITSNVTGELAAGKDAFDALRACVPAGTVSGAPKVRAMQIIDELEPHRRGPYAGVVGYVDYNGNMDTCIALRTIVFQDGVPTSRRAPVSLPIAFRRRSTRKRSTKPAGCSRRLN